MSLINSGYANETMPDLVWVSLKFDQNERSIREIMVFPKGIELKEGIPIYSVDGNLRDYKDLGWENNRFFKRSVHKCVRAILANTTCSIQEDQEVFIYMDVGRWGGNTDLKMDCLASKNQQRDFGVICGCHAVLCRFDSKKPGLLINKNTQIPKNDPYIERIVDFLEIICGKKYGVKIIKWESVIPKRLKKVNDLTVNVFLGDLHLPLYIKEPELKKDYSKKLLDPAHFVYDDSFMGKVKWPLFNKYTSIGKVTNSWELRDWYKGYFEGDIFRGAEDDLVIFLKNIEVANNKKMDIRFFQLGDMYDLWIGLDGYYKLYDGPPGQVGLLEDGESKTDQSARKFIKYYIEKANACFPNLIRQFNSLRVKEKIILYGNHDCYLAVYNPKGETLKRNYYDNKLSNIFCEHGHWIDSFNYDGNKISFEFLNKTVAISPGHRITQLVYAWPWIRDWDPNRRYSYIAGSSLEYYKRDFSFFVMGHTHLPFLTKVCIGRMYY